MFLYLSKLLPALVFPPASTLLLLLAAAFLRKIRPRLAGVFFSIAVICLYVLSTGMFADFLMRNLETRYPPARVESVPEADAIVVLGGYLHSAGGQRRYSEFMEAADRLWMGSRLYHAGKAPIILLTGGNVQILGSYGVPEARAAKDFLREWGVPDDAILVEDKSQNTHENAAFSKPILAARRARKLLLVTSAYHMPRAVAIFRREGLDVTPVATDYQTGWGEPAVLFQLLPDAEALARSKGAIREWMGLAVYRLRGWA